MAHEDWTDYKLRMTDLRKAYTAQRQALWQLASYDTDEHLMRALTARWAPLELVAQDEHTTTVRDWRTDDVWHYAGVVPIEDLNDMLLNAQLAYVDPRRMVHTQHNEWTLELTE
jgi:hypothetical protein